MSSIQQVLRRAEAALVHSDSPRLDAELLLGHCLGKTREYLFARSQQRLTAPQSAQFERLLQRRRHGEPVAYLTGKRQFWDLELRVDGNVLIPRPETELLVASALQQFAGQPAIRVADLGTGSGAIALALARHRPAWRVLAVDISGAALAVARANAARLQLTNVQFRQASWCEGLPRAGFDLLLANPPYVATGDAHLQRGDLRFEPNLALAAAEQGFAALFAISRQARRCLKPGGWLLLEHGFDQQPGLQQELCRLGYCQVQGKTDMTGHPRMLQARWPADQGRGEAERGLGN